MGTDLKCQLCGEPATNSIVINGATIVGCPCVPEHIGMISLDMSRITTRRASNGTGRRRALAIHFKVDPEERALLDRLSERMDLSLRDVLMRAVREMEARQ